MKKIRYFFEEINDKFGGKLGTIFKLLISLGSLVLILGLFLGWFEGAATESGIENDTSYLEMYDVLSTVDIGQPEKSAIKKDILLKNPFISEIDLDNLTDFIIENEKARVKEETGNDMYALELNIYTREIVYSQNLAPPGKLYYQHKDGWLASFDKRLAGYKNHVKDINMFYATILLQDDYMSDEEYKDFLRVMELSALLDDSTDRGIRAHVLYDLKVPKDSDAFYDKVSFYEDLLFKQLNDGEPGNMYVGSGGYLLEYYQEMDPKFYDYIINY